MKLMEGPSQRTSSSLSPCQCNPSFFSGLMYCRPGSIPQVKEIDGDYQVSAAGFEWRPPVDKVENGRLEFNIAGDDAEGFFPVKVQYNTATTVCSVDVFSNAFLRLTVLGQGCEIGGHVAGSSLCTYDQSRIRYRYNLISSYSYGMFCIECNLQNHKLKTASMYSRPSNPKF
jgi:hypothetical protein